MTDIDPTHWSPPRPPRPPKPPEPPLVIPPPDLTETIAALQSTIDTQNRTIRQLQRMCPPLPCPPAEGGCTPQPCPPDGSDAEPGLLWGGPYPLSVG